MATLGQDFDDIGPHETGAAGDQSCHELIPPMRANGWDDTMNQEAAVGGMGLFLTLQILKHRLQIDWGTLSCEISQWAGPQESVAIHKQKSRPGWRAAETSP